VPRALSLGRAPRRRPARSDGVPLDRIRRDLAERGIPLAMGRLVSFVDRAADLLAPIDGLHWRKLLASSWIAADGTGIKVLLRGLSSAHDGYVELYRNQGCAAFQYAAHKGSDDVVDKLAPFPLHAHRECRASLQRRGRDGPRDRGRP
jgi:hypothetical protein